MPPTTVASLSKLSQRARRPRASPCCTVYICPGTEDPVSGGAGSRAAGVGPDGRQGRPAAHHHGGQGEPALCGGHAQRGVWRIGNMAPCGPPRLVRKELQVRVK